ncbi:hypothetical protein [Protofrankia symbiont of Coriaria ruscifolia]|uniref:hypothetical protein n=1 Tax=Protofrankia symbiont of Coriaria ruscifolia TaxID=1306542 RepID=UPI001A9416B3|nr:hypothetical protein [Protofrankia symbiont of Coriaria ruscifolia]
MEILVGGVRYCLMKALAFSTSLDDPPLEAVDEELLDDPSLPLGVDELPQAVIAVTNATPRPTGGVSA